MNSINDLAGEVPVAETLGIPPKTQTTATDTLTIAFGGTLVSLWNGSPLGILAFCP